MAKFTTTRLDPLYAAKIHGPRIDGFPIYARTDGGVDTGVSDTPKSTKWILGTATKFSSPNNIRKVFITQSKVFIQSYAPIAGVSGGSLWREAVISDDENPVKTAMYMANFTGYVMTKAIGQTGEEAKRVIIKGNPLSAIIKPWVCSNLEEIYFDSSVFMSEDVRVLSPAYEAIYRAVISHGNIQVNKAIPQSIFEQTCGGNIKSLRGRFPRLRTIGYIEMLGSVLDTQVDKRDQRAGELDTQPTPWVYTARNKEIISQLGGMVSISNVGTDLHKYNDNFSIRSGVYRFDDEVLQAVFNRIKERNREKHLAEKAGTLRPDGSIMTQEEVTVQNNVNKSDFEIALDTIRVQSNSADNLKIVIALTMSGRSLNEIKKELAKMSPAGEKLYGDLFNRIFKL